MKEKVVLAYSGGLDTSYCVKVSSINSIYPLVSDSRTL